MGQTCQISIADDMLCRILIYQSLGGTHMVEDSFIGSPFPPSGMTWPVWFPLSLVRQSNTAL